MTVLTKTMQSAICKIALKKIGQRIGIYATSSAIPLVGDVILLCMFAHDLYEVSDYYNKNRTKIDETVLATIEATMIY